MVLTQKVHDDGVPQQEGEAHQNPGQEWGLEVQEAKEVHADVGVPPAPHVDQHDGEGLT